LLHALGITLYGSGRHDEARTKAQAALDMRLAFLDPNDDAIAASYNALAAIAKEQGEIAEALEWMERGTAIQVRRYGQDSPQVAMYEYNRARILMSTDDLDTAEALLRHALDVRRKTFGSDSARAAEALVSQGEIALKRKDTVAAEAVLTEAVGIFDVRLGKPHASTLQARYRLVQCLLAAQRIDEALALNAEVQTVARTSKQLNASQLKAIEELGRQVEKAAASRGKN
jgi:tetratricopeptide (TPR) repeat protein